MVQSNAKKINYWKIVTYIIYFVIIIFALAAISSQLSVSGYRLYTVQSGSMEPTIKTGSLVFVKTNAAYSPNDIITFYKSDNSKETVTHRLIELKTEGGHTLAITKGDANAAEDSQRILSNSIIGKAVFSVPHIGYPIAFARTLPGLVIFVIVPATIIIYDEILKIKEEIKKRRQKKVRKNVERS